MNARKEGLSLEFIVEASNDIFGTAKEKNGHKNKYNSYNLFQQQPHFLQKDPRHSYRSKSVLGHLFDFATSLTASYEIQLYSKPISFQLDRDMQMSNAGQYLEIAQRVLNRYLTFLTVDISNLTC
jgi:hypothetical protein